MRFKIGQNLIKKVIAALVSNCFLFSFCFAPSAQAALEARQAAKEYKQIFENFILPYSYGKITDSNFADSDRIIINIQDLHCHPGVQKNISKIIELFDKHHGVKNVYLEGAFGDVDTSWLSFGDASEKQKLLEAMLETGRLTGAEYFSALKQRMGLIKGLEEKEPYLKNLKTFGKILEEQEEINEILFGIEESMLSLKAKYYNKRQFKLEKLFKEYSENKISQRKYYSILQKHTDRLGIGLYKYQNTLYYLEMLEAEQRLDYKAIGKQLQALISSLKDRIPYGAYKALLDSTSNFSEADKLYGYLISIARKFEIDLTSNFPQLDGYFKYVELSQKINPLELIDEERRLKDEINMRFSDTKAQKEIVFLISFGKYIKEFLSGKITASDYRYYKDNIEKFGELYVKYVDNKVLSLIDGYMRRGSDFYEINLDRNKYFAKQLKIDGGQTNKDRDVQPLPPPLQDVQSFPGLLAESGSRQAAVINSMKDRQIDIVITGGFHTEGVSKILRDANVSYLVITPNVPGGLKEAEETYYRVAKEQGKISYQALANLITSLSLADQIKIMFALSPKTAEKLYGKYIAGNKVIAQGVEILELTNGRYEELKSNETASASSAARRRIIEFAKALQSDDETKDVVSAVINEVKDRLPQDLKGKVSKETLEKIDPVLLSKAINGEDARKLRILVESAADNKNPLVTKINLFLADIKNISLLAQQEQAVREYVALGIIVLNFVTQLGIDFSHASKFLQGKFETRTVSDEDKSLFFKTISDSSNVAYLRLIANAVTVPAIFKFAAFNRIAQLKKSGQIDYDLTTLGKTLANEAQELLKSYIDDKDNGKIFEESPYRDAEIGAIGAAAIINLKYKYPDVIPDSIELTFKTVIFDYNTVAAITSEIRYKNDGNTNSTMAFGDFFTKGKFNILLLCIAHEFMHNIQKNNDRDGVKGIEGIEFPYIENVNAAISEMHADAAAMLLAADLGIAFKDFREAFQYKSAKLFVDRHTGARSFLEGLMRHNGGDLSIAQSARLCEAILEVMKDSAEKYKELAGSYSITGNYYDGAAVYFEKILSKWSGEKIIISDKENSDIGGYLPTEEIFKQAVDANKKNMQYSEAAVDREKEAKPDIKSEDFSGKAIEQKIAGLEEKLLELGISNIPDFALRSTSMQYYKTDLENPYGSSPAYNGVLHVIGISPKQFIDDFPHELSFFYNNLTHSEIFLKMLRNTFMASKFGDDVIDSGEKFTIEKTPVFIALNHVDGNETNVIAESTSSMQYDLSDIESSVAYRLSPSRRWYQKTDGSAQKGEMFSVQLSAEELEKIKEAVSSFIDGDLSEYVKSKPNLTMSDENKAAYYD
ncbi:MAG: hypothetical protein LBU09_01960, partial [Endomicrobium sp.]|nr:hypothetical protein [Endomicrobium sp.]